MWLDTLRARMGRRAFLWTRKAGARNLGVLPGGNYSSASDINDLDEVAGTSGSAAGERAVLWTTNGNMRDLGTLPGDTSSEASAINNNGDVVGYSKGPRGMRAFLWTQATGMQDLGVLPGGNSSRALGINDMGAVVGSSTSSSGDRAFIWTKQAGMRDLNSAASVASGVVFFEAHAINNTGQILVMGSAMHGSHGSGEAASQCAPAPPSSFLLTPVSNDGWLRADSCFKIRPVFDARGLAAGMLRELSPVLRLLVIPQVLPWTALRRRHLAVRVDAMYESAETPTG